MDYLSKMEKELVCLGASIGSNCIPCIANHIAEAKKTGLTEAQIKEAIELAEKVKSVPDGLVLNTAYAQLEDGPTESTQISGDTKPSCCG